MDWCIQQVVNGSIAAWSKQTQTLEVNRNGPAFVSDEATGEIDLFRQGKHNQEQDCARGIIAFWRMCFAKIAWQFSAQARTERRCFEQFRKMRPRVAACIIIALRVGMSITAAEQQPAAFAVPKKDSLNAQQLANQLAALSPAVDRNEANLLAECAYATVARLRQEYRMFGTPIFNNFLIFHGLKKRGYCYQWSEDLLVALDTLKLKTLELHWGESYAGTYRENNCLVVTAKGQPFERGMILECWRHFGHLRWNLVPSDQDRYYENANWAQRVRTRAASKASRIDHRVAFQTTAAPEAKAGN